MTDSVKRKNGPLAGCERRRNAARMKGLIFQAGIHRLAELARAAGMSASALSNHLSGRHVNPQRQMDIYMAFRRLGGARIGPETFWGPLWLAGEAA